MGSSCVRACERTAHEYAAEDFVGPGATGVPGLGFSSSSVPPAAGHFSCPNSARLPDSGDDTVVPPVPNWFQALKERGERAMTETPRFDEVLVAPGTAGSHDQLTTSRSTYGVTPGGSPRESPRPADEKPGDKSKSDEISYEGTYLGAMKHGTGRLRMKGCTYEGDFLHDLKHGSGVLKWDDGRQYRGEFESGKFHGNAVMTWPDMRKYAGQYAEDRKHGEGTFSWQDGRRYQGQWVAGKRHGIGIYTNAKGLTRTGMWQMDRPLHWDVPEQAVPTGGATSGVARPEPQVLQPAGASDEPAAEPFSRTEDALRTAQEQSSMSASSRQPPAVEAQQPAEDDAEDDTEKEPVIISDSC